jgi:hypothetical protein
VVDTGVPIAIVTGEIGVVKNERREISSPLVVKRLIIVNIPIMLS